MKFDQVTPCRFRLELFPQLVASIYLLTGRVIVINLNYFKVLLQNFNSWWLLYFHHDHDHEIERLKCIISFNEKQRDQEIN